MEKGRIQEALVSYGNRGLEFPRPSEPVVDLLRQERHQLAGVAK